MQNHNILYLFSFRRHAMYTKVTIMIVRRASDVITAVTVAVDEVVFDAIAIFYGDIDKKSTECRFKIGQQCLDDVGRKIIMLIHMQDKMQ